MNYCNNEFSHFFIFKTVSYNAKWFCDSNFVIYCYILKKLYFYFNIFENVIYYSHYASLQSHVIYQKSF